MDDEKDVGNGGGTFSPSIPRTKVRLFKCCKESIETRSDNEGATGRLRNDCVKVAVRDEKHT